MNFLYKLIFNDFLLNIKIYRILIYFVFRKIKYPKNYFVKTDENILSLHTGNLYKDKIEKRFEQKIKPVSALSFSIDNIPDYELFFKVDLDKMCSIIGSRFTSGYDPLVNLAIQIIKNTDFQENIHENYLQQYLKKFQPKNYAEVFKIEGLSALKKMTQYSFFFPWQHKFPPRILLNGLFGPKHNNVVKFRATRLKNIINLVNSYGYIPTFQDCIQGYILIHDNQDYRFVVTSGTHRSSVLSAKKIIDSSAEREVLVRFDEFRCEKNFFIVRRSEVNQWPSVKNKYLNREDSLIFFDSFFKDKNYFD